MYQQHDSCTTPFPYERNRQLRFWTNVSRDKTLWEKLTTWSKRSWSAYECSWWITMWHYFMVDTTEDNFISINWNTWLFKYFYCKELQFMRNVDCRSEWEYVIDTFIFVNQNDRSFKYCISNFNYMLIKRIKLFLSSSSSLSHWYRRARSISSPNSEVVFPVSDWQGLVFGTSFFFSSSWVGLGGMNRGVAIDDWWYAFACSRWPNCDASRPKWHLLTL